MNELSSYIYVQFFILQTNFSFQTDLCSTGFRTTSMTIFFAFAVATNRFINGGHFAWSARVSLHLHSTSSPISGNLAWWGLSAGRFGENSWRSTYVNVYFVGKSPTKTDWKWFDWKYVEKTLSSLVFSAWTFLPPWTLKGILTLQLIISLTDAMSHRQLSWQQQQNPEKLSHIIWICQFRIDL